MRKTPVTMMAALFVGAAMMFIGCGSGSDGTGERHDAASVPAEPPAVKTEAAKTAVGGDTQGISFKVDGKLYSAEDFFGTYFTSENRTDFTGGPEEGWNLSFGFEGKGPGTYKASANLMYEPLRSFDTDNLTVTITSYGDVRGNIEGTFFGTLTSISDPANTMKITDGKFTAWRTPFD